MNIELIKGKPLSIYGAFFGSIEHNELAESVAVIGEMSPRSEWTKPLILAQPRSGAHIELSPEEGSALVEHIASSIWRRDFEMDVAGGEIDWGDFFTSRVPVEIFGGLLDTEASNDKTAEVIKKIQTHFEKWAAVEEVWIAYNFSWDVHLHFAQYDK